MAKVNIENTKIIIGLGNPGENYQNTYHNTGFLFIDYLAKKNPASSKLKVQSSKLFRYYSIMNGRYRVIAIKPLTFMNESGKAVKAALRRFRAKPAETLIVHDDSDIEMGKYKLSFGRGSAGHKGVKSVLSALKTKDFWRLRIGIRKRASGIKYQVSPKHPAIAGATGQAGIKEQKTRVRAGELVLKQISKDDMGTLEDVFCNILTNIR